MKRGKRLPEEMLKRMKSYYQSGMHVDNIAEHFDVSRVVVYKYIKKGGWMRGGWLSRIFRLYFR